MIAMRMHDPVVSVFRGGRHGGSVLPVLLAAVPLLLSPSLAPAQTQLERQLRAALANPPHPGVKVGACVIDLATGQTIFASGADTPLTPASTMKLFVMAAALRELGPDFSF